jgi:hypothetical protein
LALNGGGDDPARNAYRFNLKTVVGRNELCSARWLSWEAAMRILTLALAVIVLSGAGANAQHIKDPPWNPEHIDRLPADVRGAVMAKCPERPNAGHYFATYFHDEIHLHYEHLHCDTASYCNGSQCLHQVYKLSTGHYHLQKSYYGSRND